MASVPQAVTRAYADIQAIVADGTKTESERRALIRARRAQACGDQFDFNFKTSKTVLLTNADGQWTISATALSYTPATGLVELFGVVVLRDGVNVGLDPHQQYVNPPILFPDPDGTIAPWADLSTRFRVDPAAVILAALLDQAAS